jgi:hypothetical protein
MYMWITWRYLTIRFCSLLYMKLAMERQSSPENGIKNFLIPNRPLKKKIKLINAFPLALATDYRTN